MQWLQSLMDDKEQTMDQIKSKDMCTQSIIHSWVFLLLLAAVDSAVLIILLVTTAFLADAKAETNRGYGSLTKTESPSHTQKLHDG